VQGVVGKSQSSGAVPCPYDFSYLASQLYNSEGFLRQELLFIKIPTIPGHHKIIPYKLNYCDDRDPAYGVLYTSVSDGDVAGDQYQVLSTEDNYIDIEDYNAVSKEIKGTFQVTFTLESKGYGHNLPDTLRFTEGRFHTKIIDFRKSK
jgi:hypothetical protein